MATRSILQHSIDALKRIRIPASKKSDCVSILTGLQSQKNIEEKDKGITDSIDFPTPSCRAYPKPYQTFEEAVKSSPRTKDWKVVSYQHAINIKLDDPIKAVQRAKNTIMRFENIYPPSVAHISGDWQLEDRNMKKGDLFVQSIPVFPFSLASGLASIICIDQVEHIYDTEERCGFTVVTTDKHDEVGEHTVWVRTSNENTDTNSDIGTRKNCIVLESISASAFKPHVFGPGLMYARWLQERAHTLGKDHLVSKVKDALQDHR